MRVLVTGGHGFIGSHLVRLLLEDGSTVRCLHRGSGRPAPLADLDVEIVPGDLRRRAGLEAALAGVDEVYHLAGLTSSLTRQAMFETNAEGTRRLVEAARAAGVTGRFVLCSSSSVAGPAPAGAVLEESAACRPLTWYAQSKLAGEDLAREHAGGMPLTILRPTGVYGPRDAAWLPLFRSAAAGLSLLAGDPTKRYSLVHAEDLARALVAAARAPATAGGTYFVAHPEVLTLLELTAAAEQAVGRQGRRLALPESLMRLLGRVVDLGSQLTGRSSVLGSQRMKEVAVGDWTCSPAALARDSGWEARIPLAEGFPATAAWYRAQGQLR